MKGYASNAATRIDTADRLLRAWPSAAGAGFASGVPPACRIRAGGALEKVEAALRAAHVQLEFVIEPPSVPAPKSGWESTHRTTGEKVL